MSFLQNLHDTELDAQSYQLLQEMEIGDDDDDEIFNNLVYVCEEPLTEEETWVIFSPIAVTKEQVKNWGPVQAQRKSSRVDVGEKTMLEIAVNKKKMLNLEMEKHKYKGTLLKNSFEYFSDPNFINTARKVGIEIDRPNVDKIEQKRVLTKAKSLWGLLV